MARSVHDPHHPVESPPERLAVIGAGPVGLEVAHYALRCGYSVRCFELASEVAPRLAEQAHVQFGSSWASCRTAVGDAAISSATQADNCPRPSLPTSYATGDELLRLYFGPLAAALPSKTLWLNQRVVGVARAYLNPEDFADNPVERILHPFRILTRNAATGEERSWSAEFLVDCTGGGLVPAWLGSGGIPAIGEMGSTHRIDRAVPDISGKERGRFAGRKTLLVGTGPQAAICAVQLAELAERNDETQFYWAVDNDLDSPYPGSIDPAEPMPLRQAVTRSKANLLVRAEKPYLLYSRRTQVEEVRYSVDTKKFSVTLQVDRQTKRYQFDNIIACIGYRREPAYLKHLRADEPQFFDLHLPGREVSDAAMGRIHDSIQTLFRQITGNEALDLYASERLAA